MYFLITTHKSPLFYADNANHPLRVDDINYTYEKNEINTGGRITSKRSSEPMISDPMQAISVLYQHNIPGYKSRVSAKNRAAELGLTTWKYLKID